MEYSKEFYKFIKNCTAQELKDYYSELRYIKFKSGVQFDKDNETFMIFANDIIKRREEYEKKQRKLNDKKELEHFKNLESRGM